MLIQHNEIRGKNLLDYIKSVKTDNINPLKTALPVDETGIVLYDFDLQMIAPSCNEVKLASILPVLNQVTKSMDIAVNFERIVMFLAQTLHESWEFKYETEIASGKAYEKRVDLGNTPVDDGDGPRYKGHSYLQITGLDAHRDFGEWVIQDKYWSNRYVELYNELPEEHGNPFVMKPELLTILPWSVVGAGWVWSVFKNLNPVADTGNFKKTTKRINGGYTNQEDRIRYFHWVRKCLSRYQHLALLNEENYIL